MGYAGSNPARRTIKMETEIEAKFLDIDPEGIRKQLRDLLERHLFALKF